jgi:hypothetical protein
MEASTRDFLAAGLRAARPAAVGSGWRTKLGWVASGVAVLFLFLDGGVKVLELRPAIEGTVGLGFPASSVFGIGLLELICLAVFLVPRTSLLGAVLLTAHLGGAVAANVRASEPFFSHTLFPVYFASIFWGGLYLRDDRVRRLLIWSTPGPA